MINYHHQTVLLNEAVDGLNVKPNGIYVDCTLGGGGHSANILKRLDHGHLFAFDQDELAIDYNRDHLKQYLKSSKLSFIHDNFRNIKQDLNQAQIDHVDGIIYDLGVSSPQFDDGSRGFSYQLNARLDMRMNQEQKLDAWIIVNTWSYQQLIKIFFRYGQERFSKPIARRIERDRKNNSIDTTGDLVKIIKESIPAAARRHGGHPAKKVFQAIRIAVNDELGSLEESIEQSLSMLKPGGRISVITFQSLEDRLIKTMFKEVSTIKDVPHGLPVIPDSMKPSFKMVNKKPIVPNQKEMAGNHRSHSAKLRIIQKIK
ncbi:ribosomal RNA small subunit methyltransferase H [Philodulcilactobacillus myokoensis]|uniref:Ribosomal RNA small subunit methyltransferase H n=1 Tax=Philodulcilactobacillus myokoensis TaxID=2929573 RepID=A0A9W6B1Q2_9LACO|nr:16S rRNA (cytosine(1402)-N(4))-methyltransferase RsmH [Philodulcilactobacillus myokoensis]GLB47028.1 ribosomal RNA small subunit methyltransferase H [Philodulcilactobacillus myokoensis]